MEFKYLFLISLGFFIPVCSYYLLLSKKNNSYSYFDLFSLFGYCLIVVNAGEILFYDYFIVEKCFGYLCQKLNICAYTCLSPPLVA